MFREATTVVAEVACNEPRDLNHRSATHVVPEGPRKIAGGQRGTSAAPGKLMQ